MWKAKYRSVYGCSTLFVWSGVFLVKVLVFQLAATNTANVSRKTTLLQMLRDGRLSVNAPTLYPNNEDGNFVCLMEDSWDRRNAPFQWMAS